METNKKNIFQGIEFGLIFIGIPLIIFFEPRIIHPVILLVPFSLVILLYLRLSKKFRFKSLIQLNIPRKTVWKNSMVVLSTAFLLIAYVYFFERENLFNLPRKNPKIWLLICLGYPLFSAYLQEIIFRSFLFTRYASLFKKKIPLILASSLAFSFVHIVYFNPVSIVFTFLAGVYLSIIYAKTGSVLFTAIIHSVLGIFIFTIGIGQYFWLNMEKYL